MRDTPASRNEAIEKGRAAFERHAWAVARERLADADSAAPLAGDDLERLAVASYLTGREGDAIAAWKRLHRSLLEAGRPERAARWGFWLSLTLLFGGEGAQSAGWLARTQRILDGHPGCTEQGLLLVLSGLSEMRAGRTTAATTCFERASAVANRFPDDDLVALSLLSRGQALIQDRRPAQGVVLLDEAMVTVTSGAVSPMAAGIVYCAVILTAQRVFDLDRAREWTSALNEWCAGQADMVPFRGPCLVHRSEILLLQGEWGSAMEEARRSCRWYTERTERASGRAFYQLGEVHRLLGELDSADEMYRKASRHGMEPQPGLSLLRLAQGEIQAALGAIRRVVDEAQDRQGPRAGAGRAGVLGPYVEVTLAAGEVEEARAAAAELCALAASLDAPLLRAQSAQWTGAVALAEGDGRRALTGLREAWRLWQQLGVPYESARVQVLIGRACEGLGDEDTAKSHLDAARAVFERLGAKPALARLGGERGARASGPPTSLTARELEVLALVASGRTNRQIAAKLHISEHTVARHMANILRKLGVPSRTAAAALALESGLV